MHVAIQRRFLTLNATNTDTTLADIAGMVVSMMRPLMATSPKPDGPSLRIIVESLMMMTKQIKLKKLSMIGTKIHLRLPIFSSICVIFSSPIWMAQSAPIDHRSLLHILVTASRKALHHSLTHVLAYAYLVRLHSSLCGNPISACTFQRLLEEARDWFGS